MPTLSLVIPAYNEEARLPALLATLARSAAGAVEVAGMSLHETLIVDDGSSDGTREILRRAEDEQQGLRAVLEYERNRGKGAAVATGVLAARGEYVLIADVDLSTPLEELGNLAEAMRAGADVAIGSRAIEGAMVERGPVHRKLLGKAFNGTVRMLTGLDAHDTQCGFKLLRTRDAQAFLAAQICPGFAYDVELLLRADQAGLKIVEVPVIYLHDSRSRVKVVSASLKMLRDVCSLSYRLRVRGKEAPGSPEAAPPLFGLAADDADGDAGGKAGAGADQAGLGAHRQR
ncbi:MAG TPA: dolichyl-phosphate beta-glucosyltransferase [Solirubrobacterales bacterium]|nr:dolichyl-phosphate beta-glucosyltransferase [Solirubrobacterales bacterium]